MKELSCEEAGDSGLMKTSPLRSNFGPSSAGQRVGRADAAGARVGLAVPTVRLRGSQKSTSCSDATDRAYGEGEGESEEALERSSLGAEMLLVFTVSALPQV